MSKPLPPRRGPAEKTLALLEHLAGEGICNPSAVLMLVAEVRRLRADLAGAPSASSLAQLLEEWVKLTATDQGEGVKGLANITRARLRTYRQPAGAVSFALPKEFLALCSSDGVKPETVLRGFIADLCSIQSYVSDPRPDGYISNGSDERMLAMQYYCRCGYGFGQGG